MSHSVLLEEYFVYSVLRAIFEILPLRDGSCGRRFFLRVLVGIQYYRGSGGNISRCFITGVFTW